MVASGVAAVLTGVIIVHVPSVRPTVVLVEVDALGGCCIGVAPVAVAFVAVATIAAVVVVVGIVAIVSVSLLVGQLGELVL